MPALPAARGHGPLALVVHEAGEAGGGEDERQRASGRPRISVAVSTSATSRSTWGRNSTWANASRARRRLISSSAAAVDIVEHRPGHAAAGDATKVGDRVGLAQAPRGGVALEGLDLEQRPDL